MNKLKCLACKQNTAIYDMGGAFAIHHDKKGKLCRGSLNFSMFSQVLEKANRKNKQGGKP